MWSLVTLLLPEAVARNCLFFALLYCHCHSQNHLFLFLHPFPQKSEPMNFCQMRTLLFSWHIQLSLEQWLPLHFPLCFNRGGWRRNAMSCPFPCGYLPVPKRCVRESFGLLSACLWCWYGCILCFFNPSCTVLLILQSKCPVIYPFGSCWAFYYSKHLMTCHSHYSSVRLLLYSSVGFRLFPSSRISIWYSLRTPNSSLHFCLYLFHRVMTLEHSNHSCLKVLGY